MPNVWQEQTNGEVGMMNKKLCIDCKWFESRDKTCGYVIQEVKSSIDNRTVKKHQRWDYCSVLRDGGGFIDYLFAYVLNICGPQGRYFELRKKL